ncbi:MAG: GNAT family N-acetyltransferase [Mycobacteriales bacterium]
MDGPGPLGRLSAAAGRTRARHIAAPGPEVRVEIVVRPASAPDLPALTGIYNHYVRTGHSTFDVDEFTVEQRAEWFGHYDRHGAHRLLVAERADMLLGYATSSPFRAKPGYRTSVETSVYLAPSALGGGIGRALYGSLLDLLDREGVHRAYAGIALPNPASIALHRRCGFVPVGTYTEVGWKLGRYVDVQWYERRGGAPT